MKLENRLARKSKHSASPVGKLGHREISRVEGKHSLILVAVTEFHVLSNFEQTRVYLTHSLESLKSRSVLPL